MWIFLRKSGLTKLGGLGFFPPFCFLGELTKKRTNFKKFWGVGPEVAVIFGDLKTLPDPLGYLRAVPNRLI